MTAGFLNRILVHLTLSHRQVGTFLFADRKSNQKVLFQSLIVKNTGGDLVQLHNVKAHNEIVTKRLVIKRLWHIMKVSQNV